MNEGSWALKAVEREAMLRASASILTLDYIEAHLQIRGLSMAKVMKLAEFYEKATGLPATEIE